MLGIAVMVTAFVVAASHHGWQFNAVLSGSMEPSLQVGGLVVIRPVLPCEIQTGDIISFQSREAGTPVCHRVMDVRGTSDGLSFMTKGDANEELDREPVAAQEVSGKAAVCVPYLGYVGYAARLGSTGVSVAGEQVPVGALCISGMAVAVIGLTVKDMVEEVAAPSRRRRREVWEKRQERLAKRPRPPRKRAGLAPAKARAMRVAE
jgi:signal peptidase I